MMYWLGRSAFSIRALYGYDPIFLQTFSVKQKKKILLLHAQS